MRICGDEEGRQKVFLSVCVYTVNKDGRVYNIWGHRNFRSIHFSSRKNMNVM